MRVPIRLTAIAIPRIRDFRGLNARSFDGRGNYSMGVREQIIFPEIDYDKVEKIHGMDITFVTTTTRDDEALALLERIPTRTPSWAKKNPTRKSACPIVIAPPPPERRHAAFHQRVEAMRQQTDQRLTDENGQLRRSLLDLQNQIEQMRGDLARMTGQNEQLQRTLSEMQSRQSTIDDRLKQTAGEHHVGADEQPAMASVEPLLHACCLSSPQASGTSR